MANNYTQFSEDIPAKSDEEKDFICMGFTDQETLTERLANDAEVDGTYDKDHDYSEDAEALYTTEFGADALRIMDDWGLSEFKTDDDGIWIHADEGANLDLIAEVVGAWQRKFNIQEPWHVTWADSCSKPRLSEFGGGGMVIYKGKAHWMNVYSWVDAMESLLKGTEAADGEAALNARVLVLQQELDGIDYKLHGILEHANVREVVDESDRDVVLAAIAELALGGVHEDGEVHTEEADATEGGPEASTG